MKFEDALKAEIGDVLKASIPSSAYKEFEGDEVILIAKVRDYNGLENDTGGVVYNRRTGLVYESNIQNYKAI